MSPKKWPKPEYDVRENEIIRIQAIVFSCITLVSGIVFFFSYSRLPRRPFRQQLIFCLITADWLRQIWGISYPIIYLSSPRIRNTGYCQFSGFFSNTMFTAVDIIIIFMSIHAIICILRPLPHSMKTDEGGLAPYKEWLFATLVVTPMSISAIPFIDSDRSYIPLSTWCWLDNKRIYWRLVFGWLPRYAAFIIVITTYFILLYHVRKTYKQIGETLLAADRNESTNTWTQCFHGRGSESVLQSATRSGFGRRRLQILRSMRAFFAFPTMYIILWQVPFIQHVLMWLHPQHLTFADFILANMSAAILASQGTITVLIYMAQEKPWRKNPRQSPAFSGRPLSISSAVDTYEVSPYDSDKALPINQETEQGQKSRAQETHGKDWFDSELVAIGV